MKQARAVSAARHTTGVRALDANPEYSIFKDRARGSRPRADYLATATRQVVLRIGFVLVVLVLAAYEAVALFMFEGGGYVGFI